MAQHKTLKLSALLMASALSSMTFSSISYGAGFAIMEHSVTGLGRAFSGQAAVAEDASTIFFNPAGLTNLSHAEIAAGTHYIDPDGEFNDDGSLFGGLVPLTGGEGTDGVNAIVPNFYYSHPLSDTTTVGVGINAPFGLVTDYDNTWKGRYHAVKSAMKTVNINPSIAYKATDKLSIGFGVNLQKIDVKLTQMAALAPTQALDAKARLEAEDWSWGYNLGLTFQATEATRLALAYRSKISHTLTGDGKLIALAAVGPYAAGDIVTDEKIRADVDLPETLSFAVHHKINEKVDILADATWTRWSRFQELAISSSAPGLLSSIKEENWDNSMRYGLGLTYRHDEKWTFRTGIAYDETPIKNAQFRTARVPGEDRKWVAFGASYKYSESLTFDVGYTHIFIDDAKIDETDHNGHNLNGEFEGNVDIYSAQIRWMFL